MMDQAERLRKLVEMKRNSDQRKFRVVTVSSGKGGVGKTNFVINLAIALQKKGIKVGIFDADFGMANVDILLGIRSNYNIYDILYNGKSIEDISVMSPEGVKIIPGGTGLREFVDLNEDQRNKLAFELSKISDIDILLVDTSAGVSNMILKFAELADDIIIITNPEPTSLTDAYGLIKVIIRGSIRSNINVVVNRVKNMSEASDTFEKLERTVESFLNKKILYMGYIIDDNKVRQAVRAQTPFINLYPKSEVSLCIQSVSMKLLGQTQKTKSHSTREYFTKLLNLMRG